MQTRDVIMDRLRKSAAHIAEANKQASLQAKLKEPGEAAPSQPVQALVSPPAPRLPTP